ncbi:MAG: hypothetical protein ACRECV_05935 [Xanthobacteraceae bacterium]
MRTLVASGAMALVMAVLMVPIARAADNPILRKNNDAGASSPVIKKGEPPITAMPAPHRNANDDTQQGR